MRPNNLGTKKQNQVSYTHTEVYNNETTVKSTLRLESQFIYIYIYIYKQLKKQVKEPNRYEECNFRKMLPSHKPCMSLKESIS